MNVEDLDPDEIDSVEHPPAAAGPKNVADLDLADVQHIEVPKENSHDFVPFLKNTWEGLKGAADEVTSKPLPTIAYEHLVKPAVDTYEKSREEGANPVNAGLDAAAKGTGDAASAAKGFVMPHTLPMEAYFRSRQNGNSFEDAMKDARNVATLVFGPVAAAKTLGKTADLTGGLIAKEAGVSKAAIARYREAPEAVNAATKYVKDPEALKNLVDSKVAPVTGAVDAAEEGLDTAKAGAQSAKDAVASTRQPPVALAGEIPGHLDQAADQLSKMSSESFDILDQEGHTFRTEDMAAAVDDQMRTLLIGGVEPTIGPDAAAYKALDQFKQMITDMGENAKLTTGATEVPAGVVKRMIQTLDSTSKAAYGLNAGELGPEAATNLAEVRSALNRTLRGASEAYAKKMDQLAPQTELVADMSKVFGNEQSAMGALQAAGNPSTPRGYVVRQMLQRYDAAHGTDFARQVADYYDKPRATAAEAELGVDKAQRELEDRRAAASQVNLLGANSTENAVKAIQGGRNIEARKQLEALSPETARTVQDAGVAKQFAKSTTNGSRKAKIGAGLGGAAGATVGGFIGGGPVGAVVGGHIGAGAGGVLGGLADQYGGQVVKTALDAGIKLDRLAGTKYIDPIMEAARKGPQSAAVAHYIWAQSDPGYQRLISGEEDEEQPEKKPAVTPAGMQIDNDDEDSP